MTLPPNDELVTVTHEVYDELGQPVALRLVTVKASERRWANGNSIVPPARRDLNGPTVEMTGPNSYRIDHLVPVDHEAYQPTGVAYQVTEHHPSGPQTFWIAPTVEHAGQTVDVQEVLSPRPKPGGGITYVSGPATDESMKDIVEDPDSQFRAALMGTFASKASEPVVDTTVGTRVFVGGVMVYGDTGWRDITSTATDALDPSNTGTIQLKREGSTVSLALRGVSLLPGDGPLVMGPLWQGFLPTTNRFLSSVASVPAAGSFDANEFIVLSQYAWVARRQLDTGAVSQTRPSDPIVGAITYTTSNLWPSSLPGTPA